MYLKENYKEKIEMRCVSWLGYSLVNKTLNGLTKAYFALIKKPTWMVREAFLFISLRDTWWWRLVAVSSWAPDFQAFSSRRRED